MEILNTTEHVIEFWIVVLGTSAMTLLFGAIACVGFYSLIKEKAYEENLVATIVCILITSILAFGLIVFINQGVRVSHDIKVNDWNEVFEQGYEVIKQKGEIVTVGLKR